MPCPDKQSRMTDPRIVVVGAGPAGIRACQALVASGLRPTLVDEAAKGGGQIYRQQPDGFVRPPRALYGFEVAKAIGLHATIERLIPQLDYRPRTLAWNVWEKRVHVLKEGRAEALPFDFLLIASGAMDRILPLPGWTLPGVYTLGGAQVALKYQGCAIGGRCVFLGTGPLLYLVAYQYAKAGAQVAAVIDTTPRRAKLRALPALAADPATLAKGLYYTGWLRAHGVAVIEGATPLAVLGDGRVTGLRYRVAETEREIDCDAVAFGYGLSPETQLADLAGCRFRFDETARQFLPERDADGQSTVPGIFLAGDGAEINGADVAELSGERAGLAIAAACSKTGNPGRLQAIARRLARLARFRRGLAAAFPLPHRFVATLPPETILCRCEALRVGELREAIRAQDLKEMNRLKAATRIGMGRCQGRVCAAAAAELLAHETGAGLEAVGRLRAQPPVKPIPIPISGLA
jgi:NADPH-dependent 2,4-dienoyl-CoA reductase/sulfur reductase-like enzyme